jgi:hypothetical protein
VKTLKEKVGSMKKDHKTVKNELETQTLQAKNLVK